MIKFRYVSLLIAVILIYVLLSACASVPGGPTKGDPFESYNRAMFKFNDKLDENCGSIELYAYSKTIGKRFYYPYRDSR